MKKTAVIRIDTQDGNINAYHTLGGGIWIHTEPNDARMRGIGMNDAQLDELITELQKLRAGLDEPDEPARKRRTK
jgi:hypothetical protein